MLEEYDENKLDDGRVISTVKESNITSRDPRIKPGGTGSRTRTNRFQSLRIDWWSVDP